MGSDFHQASIDPPRPDAPDEEEAHVIRCPDCDGRGEFLVANPIGRPAVYADCESCGGSGAVECNDAWCEECDAAYERRSAR